jgi:hypothetical protein
VQCISIRRTSPARIAQPSVDPNTDFIDEPVIAAGTRPLSKPVRAGRAESSAPAPDSLAGHFDASFRQQVFNIPLAETEALVEPNSMTNDFWRESAALPERFSGFHSSSVANRRLM